MKKKTSRQVQAENTKAKIMLMVKQLLANKTLDEIRVNEICKQAGVSVGAFYHHFVNKSGIIVELYGEIDIQFEQEVYPAMLQEEPIEAIYKYLERQCSIPSEFGVDFVKNIYKAQIDYGSEFFLSEGRGLSHGLYLLILRAKEKSLIRENVSAKQLTSELLIMSRGIIYNWCISDGKTDAQAITRWMATNYLHAFIA
jgi:AcrR family transcriptional regulator